MNFKSASLTVIVSIMLGFEASAETYTSWCAARFTAPELADGAAFATADFDKDQLNNFIEYFFNTDPKVPNGSVTYGSYNTALKRGTVTFNAALDREDTEYEVQLSQDLVTWSAGAATQASAPNPFVWNYPDSDQERHFARILVKTKKGYFLDSDGDGLDDSIEMALINSNLTDGFTKLGDIKPGDDFDGDGISNVDEMALGLDPGANNTNPASGADTNQYTYDDANRLIGVSSAVLVKTYQLDSEGNILGN